jgi:hypothetical protein
MLLTDYERHYALPGAVAGAFNFMVDGDFVNGHECTYNVDGLLEPVKIPRPIVLFGLQAEFKYLASGNQLMGLMIDLVARPNNHGGGYTLKSGIVSGLAPLISWTGQLPNDWGFGVRVMSAAGLGVTHKLVLVAQYKPRRPS